MWTIGMRGGGSKSCYLCSPPPHPFFFSLSGHMLNESSANLEQFMSWQTCLLYSSTPLDIWSTWRKPLWLFCPTVVCHSSSSLHHLLFSSLLSNYPLLIWSIHLPWVCSFILSSLPLVWCFTCFNFLSLLSFHCCYRLLFPFFPSLFLFLLPFHFISIFTPLLSSSLSPYSEGIRWIIQKRCKMIMGN